MIDNNSEERKDVQIGFRITRTQKRRLDEVIAKIKSIDKRVDLTEIYTELMSLTPSEFAIDQYRDYLSGKISALSESEFPSRPTSRPKVRVRHD